MSWSGVRVLHPPPCFNRGVAQPGSAPALGAGSRGFKSLRPDHVSRIEQSVAQLVERKFRELEVVRS